jgi:hypothetical protein
LFCCLMALLKAPHGLPLTAWPLTASQASLMASHGLVSPSQPPTASLTASLTTSHGLLRPPSRRPSRPFSRPSAASLTASHSLPHSLPHGLLTASYGLHHGLPQPPTASYCLLRPLRPPSPSQWKGVLLCTAEGQCTSTPSPPFKPTPCCPSATSPPAHLRSSTSTPLPELYEGNSWNPSLLTHSRGPPRGLLRPPSRPPSRHLSWRPGDLLTASLTDSSQPVSQALIRSPWPQSLGSVNGTKIQSEVVTWRCDWNVKKVWYWFSKFGTKKGMYILYLSPLSLLSLSLLFPMSDPGVVPVEDSFYYSFLQHKQAPHIKWGWHQAAR